jgi:hypothetical protein
MTNQYFATEDGAKQQTMRLDTIRDFASDGSAMDSITCAISRLALHN